MLLVIIEIVILAVPEELEDDLMVLILSGIFSTRRSCSSLLDALSLLKRDMTALILFTRTPHNKHFPHAGNNA